MHSKANWLQSQSRNNMKSPYLITEPTCISFSGGRTSAYMLHKVLEANNGLPDCARVVFANTGKEMEETLEFVRDCQVNWNVDITWIEYVDSENKFKVVNFETASRCGEPFEALIKKRNYLPNPIARFCTVELKILPMENYFHSIGWLEFDNFVGIRADEPRRVAKINKNPSDGRKGVERFMPLVPDNVTKQTVYNFWNKQLFDLNLPNINGTTMHGNCDLCFLKGGNIILSLISEKPERGIWWAKMENSITNAKIKDGDYFRKDRPSYQSMINFSNSQSNLFDDESIECFCGE